MLVFNQRDDKKRKAALKQLWTINGVLWTARGTYVGYTAIERAAAGLLRSYPEYDFTVLGTIDEIPGATRMRWSFGAPDSAPAITGLDVVVAINGRIVATYRFLDGAEL